MDINNKPKKERLSKLQRTILEVLKTGKYQFINQPLNVKQKYNSPYYEWYEGNYHELMEQVSKQLNKGTDRKILNTSYHRPSEKFKVSFSRAIRLLAKKGLVDLVYYHNLMDNRLLQKEKCDNKQPLDNRPCNDCEKVRGMKVLSFFIDDEKNKCMFSVLSRTKRRGEYREKSKLFAVFLKDKPMDSYDEVIQYMNRQNQPVF